MKLDGWTKKTSGRSFLLKMSLMTTLSAGG
jgi:hypothetical protein